MNRIDKKFIELKKAKKKALIFFITAGDPSLKRTGELIHAIEREGADLIELGVPFSDPLADGPVIQAASMRSLKRGTTLKKILAIVKQARKRSQLPLLLMSYLNPVLHYGLSRFARDAKNSGVDGLIVPDLPPEEGREVAHAMGKQGLNLVYLLAPTSTAQRRKIVTGASRGFVYYVSLTGVTGMRSKLPQEIQKNIHLAKKETRLPVCAGFGVSTPEQAKAVVRSADGVIIGSAVVKALAANPQMSAEAFSKKFIRPFARALRRRF